MKNNHQWLVLVANHKQYNLRAVTGYLSHSYTVLLLSCLKPINTVFINPEGPPCFCQYASKSKHVETFSLFQHHNKMLKQEIRKEELRIKLDRVYKYIREVGTA